MNSYNQLKLDVISKVSINKISIKDASQILNKSHRTIERYLAKYHRYGAGFLKHGNSGRSPVNKTSVALESEVKKLIKDKYFDFNILHLRDFLKREENIILNRETLRNWSHQIHHVKRKKRRRAKARYRRDRVPQKGLLIQLDGSPHRWFGKSKSCLIAAIDDADGSLLHSEFFHSEDSINCMRVLQSIIQKHGIFNILYVDRAGIYGGQKRALFSQVKRALEELGVQVIFANSPQAKGRIERVFNTLQDRLIPEMRLRNIKSFPAANYYLQEQFIPNYWNKELTVVPESFVSAFKRPPQEINLNEVFCFKEYRQVNRDHTVSYNGDIYAIRSPLKYSISRQKIEIRNYQNLKMKFYYAGKELEVIKIKENRRKKAA